MQSFFCKIKIFDYNYCAKFFNEYKIKVMDNIDKNKNIDEKQKEEQAIVMKYLSLFNELDKYFDTLVETDRFMPYNDKLKQISEWKFAISWFVRLHLSELKYFWELRNHIAHGLKVDEYLYAIPTDRAISKLSEFIEKIVEPPLCIDYFRKEVYSVHLWDKVSDVLKNIKSDWYTYIPVYNNNEDFLWVITESWILQWISEQMLDQNFIDLSKVRVEHLHISTAIKDYMFVSSNINMYQADEIFTTRKRKWKGLWAMFITKNGTSKEKIIWMISGNDIALIDDFVM